MGEEGKGGWTYQCDAEKVGAVQKTGLGCLCCRLKLLRALVDLLDCHGDY